MRPTIVQCDGFRLVIGECSHDSMTTSIGPTTDQRNHHCPDCGKLWTTWPTDEERRAILAGTPSVVEDGNG